MSCRVVIHLKEQFLHCMKAELFSTFPLNSPPTTTNSLHNNFVCLLWGSFSSDEDALNDCSSLLRTFFLFVFRWGTRASRAQGAEAGHSWAPLLPPPAREIWWQYRRTSPCPSLLASFLLSKFPHSPSRLQCVQEETDSLFLGNGQGRKTQLQPVHEETN